MGLPAEKEDLDAFSNPEILSTDDIGPLITSSESLISLVMGY